MLPCATKFLMVDMTEEFELEDFFKEEMFKEGSIWQLAGYADPDLYVPVGDGDFQWLFRNGSTWVSVPLKYGKPILHPLSDLTKHCEDLGFVPLTEIIRITDEHVCLDINRFGISPTAPIAAVNKLYEWHFAVDLPEGTWIDVNTLEVNPYLKQAHGSKPEAQS